MKRRCVTCDAELSGRGRRLYCSEECSYIERICAWCGKSQQVPRKRRCRPYCSQSCAKAGEGLKQRVEMSVRICQWCQSEYELYPSQDTPRRKFCSRRCAALGRPINGRPSKIATAAIEEFIRRCPMLVEPEKRVGRWSTDLAFPLQMIAVELDGEYWHSLPQMVEKDARKRATLTDLGWTVISIQIAKNDTPDELAAAIESAVTSTVAGATPHREFM